MAASNADIIERLAAAIAARNGAAVSESYTAKLLSKGVERCAKKLGEEAVETALAAMTGDKAHIAAESADLLYHLLVLLEATGVTLADVTTELARREGIGGIAEKAARPKG